MFRRRTTSPGSEEPQIPGFLDFALVGAGGFSRVYTAFQERFSRTVAVKVVTVDLSPEASRRFEREQQTAGQLDGHPNIIRIYASGLTERGRPYLVMEYHSLGSLSDRLRRHGPLPLADVLDIGVKLGGALDAAHRRGIVHRDVKPQNVLLSPYAGPVLADFGIAALDPGRFTVTTEAFSVNHAAPEVLGGQAATAASDLYSLASVLYELLAGRAPFADPERSDLLHLIRRVQEDPIPPIGRPDVPADVEATIVALMARDPAARPPSGAVFAEVMQTLQARLGVPATPIAPVSGGPPPVAGGPGVAPGAAGSAGSARADSTHDQWRPPPKGSSPRPAGLPAPSAPAAHPAPSDDHTIIPSAPSAAATGTDAPPRGLVAATPPAPVTPAAPFPPPAAPPVPVSPGGPSGPVADGTVVRARTPDAAPVPLADEDQATTPWKWIALGVAAVVALLVGIAIPMLRHDDPDPVVVASSTTAAVPAPDGDCPSTEPPDMTGVNVVPRLPATGVKATPVGSDGSTVEVSWTDTNKGRATYAVFLQCGGTRQVRLVGLVPPGKNTYRVTELDRRGDYCFLVGPVAKTAAGDGFELQATNGTDPQACLGG